MKSINTTFHEISLCTEGGDKYYVNGVDTVLGARLDFFIDSDSILKETNNKYRSRIGFTVYYQKAKNDTTPRPIKFKLYSRPKLDDVSVKKDTMILKRIAIDTNEDSVKKYNHYYWSEYEPKIKMSNSKDSVFSEYCIMASAYPIKNHENIWGELVEGCQSVYFYSNKLGQHNHLDTPLLRFLGKIGIEIKDCYYNYSIDFRRFPRAHYFKQNVMGSFVNFTFGDYITDSLFSYNENKKLLYNYIHPEPLRILNGRIEYFTSDVMSNIYTNNGIIIQAIDVDQMNYNNYIAFLATVIVGIIITFGLGFLKGIITFLYRLIKERRNALKLLKSSEETNNIDENSSCNGNEVEPPLFIDTDVENVANKEEGAFSEDIEMKDKAIPCSEIPKDSEEANKNIAANSQNDNISENTENQE